MIDFERMNKLIADLDAAVALMRRNNALLTMSIFDSPYKPLIRVMCKLNLIKDWPI